MPPPLITGILIVGGIILLVLLFIIGQYISLWFQALLSGARVRLLDLIMMRFRKVDPRTIVINRIAAKKAGLELSTDVLESHYLAGGRVTNVVRSMIAAGKAQIDLPWDRATAIDLAGRDILAAVNTSVNPRVIDCPDARSGRKTIDAVAKDGIQLKARARVTVRTCIERLVGGATEETIIARVGEGIVSAIGSSDTHKQVLENPDKISKVVLAKGLDAETAFEILSIDIADVDVGENIGAKLQMEQANTDLKIARAKAEERRAMAQAREQEMRALVEEMAARVKEAEAEVPRAMADSFRSGNLGIMDYYRMRNIISDTDMRTSISESSDEHSA
ncbi:MAG: flotillin-like protein FloA [Planctomycetes bacterium]|nr:flotillin-like protein FloA [Planctomycetota bacterium]